MNLKTKFRESFRPFAPSVLQDRVSEFFETRDQQPSPYMLLVTPVKQEQRAALNAAEQAMTGIDQLKIVRSRLPAVTHVDCSARLQTVDEQRHGRYYKLLKTFAEKTGVPVIINTSFNIRGEPIICTPADAYRCFMATHMDVLVVERFLLLKELQPDAASFNAEDYLGQFQPD